MKANDEKKMENGRLPGACPDSGEGLPSPSHGRKGFGCRSDSARPLFDSARPLFDSTDFLFDSNKNLFDSNNFSFASNNPPVVKPWILADGKSYFAEIMLSNG